MVYNSFQIPYSNRHYHVAAALDFSPDEFGDGQDDQGS